MVSIQRTLDYTQEAFRTSSTAKTAQAYLNAAIQYFEDGMVGEDTFNSATHDVAVYCNEHRVVLVDPRFGDTWGTRA